MTEKIRLIINNEHDTATLTATSEATPVEYTQRSGRSYPWRSTDTSEQVIEATLASRQYVSAVVVYNQNLTSTGTIQIEYLRDGSVVYDSGDMIAAELIPLGIWRVGLDAWGAEDLTELPTVQFNVWTEQIPIDGYRITINDAANPDGYIKIDRIIAGVGYSPEYNPAYGLQLEWQDFSENRRTESGSLRTVGSGMARRVSFDLSFMSKNGLQGLSQELLRVGKGRDIYISIYPESLGMLEAEHAFVARRSSNYGHSHSFYNNWESSLEFEEV